MAAPPSSLKSSASSRPAVRARVNDPLRPTRDQLASAMAERRLDDALDVLMRLELLEPKSPRWPHKRGDLLRHMQRSQDAFLAYACAVRRYVDEGHKARAQAMLKAAISCVPSYSALLAQLDARTQAAFHCAHEPSTCGESSAFAS